MAQQVSTVVLGEPELDGWARLAAASPDGSIYAMPQYLEILCRSAGGRYRVLGAKLGEELAGGVALYERDSRRGPYVTPRPLLYYNGVVMRRFGSKYPSEQTARNLKVFAALAAALAATEARVELRCASSFPDARPFQAAGWRATPGYSYVVPIDDLAQVEARMEQNLRRLAKRAEEQMVTVSSDDDFGAFYRLHAGLMDRRDVEAYLPEAAFGGYFGALRRAGWCRLYQARLPDVRVAASQLVLLGPGAVAHTAAAASDPELQRTGAASLLRLKVFEAVAALGYAALDLTDAALNPVTHFKSQLGGELRLHLVLAAPLRRRDRLAAGLVRLARGALALGRRAGGRAP